MKKSKANIVIPGHYFVKGVNIPEAYGLKSAAEWTAAHEHTLLDSATLELTPEMVKKYDQHVMYLLGRVIPPASFRWECRRITRSRWKRAPQWCGSAPLYLEHVKND